MLYKNMFCIIKVVIFFFYIILAHYVNATVVTSIKPLGFITAAITDGVTDTIVLLPDGASEHEYSLRPKDVERIRNAELIVWIGPEMETFMVKLLKRFDVYRQVTISQLHEVNQLLIRNNIYDSHHDIYCHKHLYHKYGTDSYLDLNQYNMHLWLSPEIARLSAIAIHDKLVQLMPNSRNKLDANLKDFEIQLIHTDKQINHQLTPLKGKGYFVFHDAYTYYEKHYGLTPLGYFTINPEMKPGARRLYEIKTKLIQRKAICVFTEPQFKPVIVEVMAKTTPVHLGTLDPLGTNIQLSKYSYLMFLKQLSNQYASCLTKR